jgi:hypothetical protein
MSVHTKVQRDVTQSTHDQDSHYVTFGVTTPCSLVGEHERFQDRKHLHSVDGNNISSEMSVHTKVQRDVTQNT